MKVALLAILLAAAPLGHRERAERAEAIGRLDEAAREFAVAYETAPEPSLLFRLAVVRRKLGQLVLAREALRAYLRAAPEGTLREDAERELKKVEILLEARTEAQERRAPAAPRGVRAGEEKADAAPVSPASRAKSAGAAEEKLSAAPATAPDGAEQKLTGAPAAAPDGAEQKSTAAPAAAPVAAEKKSSGGAAAAPKVAEQTSSGVAAANGVQAAAARVPVAGPASLLPSPRAVDAVPVSARPSVASQSAPMHAGPWLAGGAAVVLAGGAALWWDGARRSNSLDARFASGDLTASDGPAYGRAHNESLAGRLLVAGAVALGAAAVLAW